MITLLRKLFIKDYQNVSDKKVREKHGLLASIGGIIINALLFSFKLLIGIISSSMSIISDAINNLTDFLSCFVNLFGFKMSSKPADKEHPFGHQRIEYIAGLIVCIIIVIIGVILGYTSIMNLINQDSSLDLSIYAFIILGGSILFKILLALYNYKIGKIINSVALKASFIDSINDVISTSVVLIASLIQYFYPSLWYIDSSMSLIVSIYILISGIKMLKETSSPLIGTTIDKEIVDEIEKDVRSYEGILGIHDLIAHSYGENKIFVTLHAEVDGYISTFVSHELIDKIEKEVMEKHNILLTIHMDPIDTKNKEIPILESRITKLVKNIDERLSIHDLRMVSGEHNTNIIFDIVLPFDVKTSKEEIKKIIQDDFKNENYTIVINFDSEYIE